MEESLQAQIDTFLPHLDGLIQQGRSLREKLTAEPASRSAVEATRAWQQACAATVNQLSGGSKAHWLSRSFSQAFLVRAAPGRVLEEAPPAQIVDRLVDVLQQALNSLSLMGDGPGSSTLSETAPQPRRFEFVRNAELRPVVEQAYSDSRRDLEEGRYGRALLTSCGILEAIVTDALEDHGLGELSGKPFSPGQIADWSFEARLAVAEGAGLIRKGWVRLPAIARTYRDGSGLATEPEGVFEDDARRTRQVLHVVMRDLDPGR
jgi:hypothetical protein